MCIYIGTSKEPAKNEQGTNTGTATNNQNQSVKKQAKQRAPRNNNL